ncbi:hypothetical protein SAMN05660860_02081 [Geoalkalibacter ferrihydriticus]|uniref:Uncharacterized protein n=2 Tax=Geoalkalibacter ferrihydriticus TaxID=392333 RepID=A0A0C2DV60_9BACT|nr:hypothetical protein [Geoalkalibacter ferrihydriticus]KIH77314.1 hypothetical protein GFER_00720 [Geoalkalibacter ferrihydriticus DSM 17813]SDM20246.1 hypothetical protein SAMN05660860_02081 [Geoalkalibacter ferrihydriticus]
MKTEFNWFTGVACIAAPCPVALLGDSGLQPFFQRPNDPAWGIALPRQLYHESLHYWQLASSRHLQMIVVAEWERLLRFEKDGAVLPRSELRKSFGRAAADEPFSVRDLIECLARFWDVHTRSPTRLIREEGSDLGGRLREIDAIRPQGSYASLEFDTVMLTGPDCKVYAKPYRWMLERARAAPAVHALPGPVEESASWSVNLLLPVASFLALNTDAPVAAFVAGFERGLSEDVLGEASARRNPLKAINLDWLDFWSVLANGLSKTLKRIDLPTWLAPWVGFGVLENKAFLDHPVYRHLCARMMSLDEALDSLRKNQRMRFLFNSPPDAAQDIDGAMALREALVTQPDRWPVFSLPGQPTFRSLLGGMFAPPLVRFDDRDLVATVSAFPDWPWSIDAAALSAAVDETKARFAALEAAETAVRLGLPPNAFARDP